MNWIEKEIERDQYDKLGNELPDPPDGDPIWLGPLSDEQRETYALRIERGLGKHMSAMYHIDRRKQARALARETESRPQRKHRFRPKLADMIKVRA